MSINKILKKTIVYFLIFIIVGCKGVKIHNSKISTATEFSFGQAMILVAEEKNKYENRFGSGIWSLKSGDGNSLFKDYIVENVKTFVEHLMTLRLYANNVEIDIKSKDLEIIENAAKEYQRLLTNDDLEFIHCDYNDIFNLYKDYHLVNLAIKEIIKNSDIELSISEAKVVQVEYMVFDNEDKANEIRELLNVKNASFVYYASSNSIDTNYSLVIKRGDMMSTMFPEVFYLSTGDISEVLERDNKYYIFKCVNDYMEKETNIRKEEIMRGIKNKEFAEQYDLFKKDNFVYSNSTYWNQIDLAKGNNCKIESFYKIYKKYFSE